MGGEYISLIKSCHVRSEKECVRQTNDIERQSEIDSYKQG